MKKTLLITGAGSVKNSWEPVKKALEDHYKGEGIKIPANDLQYANCVLAHVVHFLRWSYEMKGGKEVSRKARRDYLDIKKRIAEELSRAEENGGISLRPEIEQIRRSFFTEKVRIMTTNWDRLLIHYAEKNECELHFFHGNHKDSDGIFLPSETTEDDYLKRCVQKRYKQRLGRAFEGLTDVHTLILYGISLSPLDAELGLLIGARFSKVKPARIVIVDINPCIVYQRLRFLLRENWSTLGRNIDVKLLCPDQLMQNFN